VVVCIYRAGILNFHSRDLASKELDLLWWTSW